jgi:hypothetical protein
MKKLLLVPTLALIALTFTTCGDNPTTTPTTGNSNCGTYEGFQLYKDTEGCYYMSNGRRYNVSSTACSCS